MVEVSSATVTRMYYSLFQSPTGARFIMEQPTTQDTQILYVKNERSKDIVVDTKAKTVTFPTYVLETFKPVEYMSGVWVARIK